MAKTVWRMPLGIDVPLPVHPAAHHMVRYPKFPGHLGHRPALFSHDLFPLRLDLGQLTATGFGPDNLQCEDSFPNLIYSFHLFIEKHRIVDDRPSSLTSSKS
jgi:hypothetical protein